MAICEIGWSSNFGLSNVKGDQRKRLKKTDNNIFNIFVYLEGVQDFTIVIYKTKTAVIIFLYTVMLYHSVRLLWAWQTSASGCYKVSLTRVSVVRSLQVLWNVCSTLLPCSAQLRTSMRSYVSHEVARTPYKKTSTIIGLQYKTPQFTILLSVCFIQWFSANNKIMSWIWKSLVLWVKPPY